MSSPRCSRTSRRSTPARRPSRRYEKQADRITHETVNLLHQTFITPFDREQIHGLITDMDDVLDLMEDVAQCLFLYDVKHVGPEAQQLAALCVDTTARMQEAVALLSSMKNADAILRICGEIDRLESQADRVFRTALAKLFREEPDAKRDHQAEGGHPAARGGHRQVRGRRQPDRGHRPRERVTGCRHGGRGLR